MDRKKKKKRREKLRSPSPQSLAARAYGLVVHENRRGTLVRLMDTAVRDWFLERDPFPIHFLVCGCWMVLADLGKNSGKGPQFERSLGRFETMVVYDFLRHAKPDMLNDSVDLPPVTNEWLLFDAIASFDCIFGGPSAFMQTFRAYCGLHPTGIDPKPLERVLDFLPAGTTIKEAKRLASLTRIAFFAELTEVFAQEILSSQDRGGF